MRKLGIGLGVVVFLFILGFIWLLSGASPENAPQEVVTIDLPDSYEK